MSFRVAHSSDTARSQLMSACDIVLRKHAADRHEGLSVARARHVDICSLVHVAALAQDDLELTPLEREVFLEVIKKLGAFA